MPKETAMKKYLSLTVYRNHYDSTNGGVSATAHTIYAEAADNEKGAHFHQPEPHLIFRRDTTYPGHGRLFPVNLTAAQSKLIGPMAGGNVAIVEHGSIAWHIHDRFETGEQYRLLSM
jgi:hypothetical protein